MLKPVIGSLLIFGVLLMHFPRELRAGNALPSTGSEAQERLEVAQRFVKRMRATRARHPERVPVLKHLLLVEDIQLEVKFLMRDSEAFDRGGMLPADRLQGFKTAEAARDAMRARTDSLTVEMDAELASALRIQEENRRASTKRKLREPH